MAVIYELSTTTSGGEIAKGIPVMEAVSLVEHLVAKTAKPYLVEEGEKSHVYMAEAVPEMLAVKRNEARDEYKVVAGVQGYHPRSRRLRYQAGFGGSVHRRIEGHAIRRSGREVVRRGRIAGRTTQRGRRPFIENGQGAASGQKRNWASSATSRNCKRWTTSRAICSVACRKAWSLSKRAGARPANTIPTRFSRRSKGRWT